MVLANKSSDRGLLSTWERLGRQLPEPKEDGWQPLIFESFCKITNPYEAYGLAAFKQGCSVSNVTLDFSFDELEVSRVEVSFYVSRLIKDFEMGYDPRLWDQTAPECFLLADEFPQAQRLSIVPGSLMKPAPVNQADENAAAGQSKQFLLFENAVMAAGGGATALTDFRNLLEIDYRVGPTAIELTYSLSEAISFLLFGVPTAGGLDRDSGSATIKQVPNTDVLFVKASKSVRISAPQYLRDLLNLNMAAILPFWFCNLVVLGACNDNCKPV
jgi:hypothetical protein